MENEKSKRFKLLTRNQHWFFVIGFSGGMVMLINSLYLVFAGHIAGIGSNPEELPITYQLMLIIHVLIGILFFGITIFFASMHFRGVRQYKKRSNRVSGMTLVFILIFLFVSGFFILSEANSHANAWVYVGHQIAAFIVIAIYLAHRFLSHAPPVRKQIQEGVATLALVSIVVWSVHFIETTGTTMPPILGAAEAIQLDSTVTEQANENNYNETSNLLALINNLLPFKAVGDPDPESPFFPSKTSTSTGGFLPTRILTHDDLPDLVAFQKETEEKGFAPNYYLGAQSCERCHKDIVQQWSTSAHRFSSFNNPFYRKSVELTRDKIGKKASQFCGGCHDPAIMLSGNMLKTIDPLTPESQAGLTCLSCHAIDKIHDLTGNSNYNIHDKTESPYIFDQAKFGLSQEVHDYVLKAKPTIHKKRMLKPVFKQSEFCMTCHKVNLDVSVNNYRWLRGQNEYDAWHNSGVAHNQPKTWYEPKKVRQCQACHMPLEETVLGDVAAKEGKVRSHRFLSVNTALPALRGDTDTIRRMEAFLQDDNLRIDLFAVHREDGSLQMGLQNNSTVFKPGELIQIDVVIRNKNVGHAFPGGTNDSNQGWIDFQVTTTDKEIYRSGFIDNEHFVDPASHFYQAVLVDKDSNRIEKRNAADIYTAVYNNVIKPSTSDIARYRFRIPDDAAGKTIQISAKLMWRKFNQTYTNFVFEGKEVPVLPVTTIESDSLSFNVADTININDQTSTVVNNIADDWIRFNDYGIGSFLDDDTKRALAAFEKVSVLQPEKMDGWLNMAKAYLKEGHLEKADKMLRKASALAPNMPRLAFFWGRLLEKNGRLDESIKAYSRTLQHYPDSRDTWARIGRVYWLAGKIDDSIKAYGNVLRIDPENAQAFHQLSLAYKALVAIEENAIKRQEFTEAAIEFEKGFEKYKVDEDASAVTHRYRAEHPLDNIMSQKMVIHGES